MAKDPAFLFYASDFLTGVADLTMEERGLYITLLCLHHQKGRLSDRMIRLNRGDATADATALVLTKFKKDEQGLYYNERLEIEIEKRASHSKKQSDRATKGWEKRKKEAKEKTSHGSATADATALPLEDRNRDRDRIVNRDKNRIVKEPKPKIEIQYPYEDEDFLQAWQMWKDYKKEEHKFNYKSAASEQASLMELSRLGTNKDICIKIIHQSLSNGWKGFFQLKQNNNGQANDKPFTRERFNEIINGNI